MPNVKAKGREAVMAAVIEAARGLFASRGYAGVSVRDIAKQAGVNHGLIHRYFGAKEQVLRSVLQAMFREVGALARSNVKASDPNFIERIYPLVAARKLDWQVLMRAVLDGFDFQSANFEFPITSAVLDHVVAMRGKLDQDARVRAAAIISTGLGWLLLSDYLTPILKLEKLSPEKLRARMAQLSGPMAILDR